MRRILSVLTALILLTSQVLANNWIIDSYRFVTAVTPTLTFQQCSTTEQTGGPPLTFAATNVGPENADRVNIIGIGIKDAASVYNVTSVTVGGDAAISVVDHAGASGLGSVAFFYLKNPVGTSESVVVTIDEAVTGVGICIWSTNQSAFPLSTANDGNGSASVMTLDLATTSASGFAVAVCISTSSTTQTIAWTGFIEQAENDIGSLNLGAAHTSPTSGSALTANCDPSGTATAVAAASVSFDFGTVPLITFLQCTTSTSDLQNYTFAGTNTGTPSTTRSLLIGVGARDAGATNQTVSTLTVDTIGANLLIQIGTGGTTTAFYTISQSTGTSASVVVNMSEVVSTLGICVWAMTDVSNIVTEVDNVALDNGSSGTAITLSLDVPAFGIAAGMCNTGSGTAGAAYIWTGLIESEDMEFAPSGTGSLFSSAATFINDATANTPLAVTCDPSGADTNSGVSVSLQ